MYTLIYVVVRQWGFCLITGKPGPESDLLYVAGTTRRWVDHSPADYQIMLKGNVKLKGTVKDLVQRVIRDKHPFSTYISKPSYAPPS